MMDENCLRYSLGSAKSRRTHESDETHALPFLPANHAQAAL
jgi:hypothetical protein